MKDLDKKYRHSSNPDEKNFHDAFIKNCEDQSSGDIAYSRIAFPTINGDTPASYVSDREKQIMINTIQWLGSSVGAGFLRDLGYKRNLDI